MRSPGAVPQRNLLTRDAARRDKIVALYRDGGLSTADPRRPGRSARRPGSRHGRRLDPRSACRRRRPLGIARLAQVLGAPRVKEALG